MSKIELPIELLYLLFQRFISEYDLVALIGIKDINLLSLCYYIVRVKLNCSCTFLVGVNRTQIIYRL